MPVPQRSPVPAPEQDPIILRPPCPGCPDPENARTIAMECSGPAELPDPFDRSSNAEAVAQFAGEAVCEAAGLVYCPRTKGNRVR